MEKSSEFEFEKLVAELEDFSDCRLDDYFDIVDMVPGALERLKSMKSEDDKLQYYGELMEISRKLADLSPTASWGPKRPASIYPHMTALNSLRVVTSTVMY